MRLFVILGMCLGLRLSEVLGLQWGDIDWEELQISVRRGVVQGRLGEVKTEYSEAQVPLDRELARLLRRWKSKSEFAGPRTGFLRVPSLKASVLTSRLRYVARSTRQPCVRA